MVGGHSEDGFLVCLLCFYIFLLFCGEPDMRGIDAVCCGIENRGADLFVFLVCTVSGM